MKNKKDEYKMELKRIREKLDHFARCDEKLLEKRGHVFYPPWKMSVVETLNGRMCFLLMELEKMGEDIFAEDF